MADSHSIDNAPTPVYLDEERAAQIAATQSCLNCGLPPVSDVIRIHRGILLANFLCPIGHIWTAKAVAA